MHEASHAEQEAITYKIYGESQSYYFSNRIFEAAKRSKFVETQKRIHPLVANYMNYHATDAIVPPEFQYLAQNNAEVFADHKAVALMHKLGFSAKEILAVARAQDSVRMEQANSVVSIISDKQFASESIRAHRQDHSLASQLNTAQTINHYSGILGNGQTVNLEHTAKQAIMGKLNNQAAIDTYCKQRAIETVSFIVKTYTDSVLPTDPNFSAYQTFANTELPHLWDYVDSLAPSMSTQKIPTQPNMGLTKPTISDNNSPDLNVKAWRASQVDNIENTAGRSHIPRP